MFVFKKAVNYYNNASFKVKLFFIATISTTIILATTIITSVTYTNWSINDVIINRNSDSNWIIDSLDNYIKDVVQLSGVVHYNKKIVHALDQNESLNNPDVGLEFTLSSTLFTKDYINSVIIFDRAGNRIEKFRSGEMLSEYNPVGSEWYSSLINDQRKYIIFKDPKLDELVLDNMKNKTMFSVARQIYSLDSGRAVGVMYISIDYKIITDLIHKNTVQNNIEFSIIDEKGTVVYDTHTEKNGKKSELDIPANKTHEIRNYGGEKTLFTYAHLDMANWTIVIRSNLKSLTFVIQQKMFSLTVIILLVYAVLLLVVILSFRQVTSHILKLAGLMKGVDGGNLDVKFDIPCKDEIGILADGFNSMVARIRFLIDKVYKTEIENKEAQLRALQRQINPHFIYNTLESIRMMAYANNDMEVEKMICIFGKLLHNNISEQKKVITVREELENIRNYLYIQQVRLKDKLEIKFDIEDEIYDYRILKLILQPLVENAIKHGLAKKKDGGTVLIRGYTSDEYLIFAVKDNGIGINEERLTEINLALAGDGNYLNIGLRNVNERIKLHYGKKYGLQIYGEKGKGAVSKLILPNNPQEDA